MYTDINDAQDCSSIISVKCHFQYLVVCLFSHNIIILIIGNRTYTVLLRKYRIWQTMISINPEFYMFLEECKLSEKCHVARSHPVMYVIHQNRSYNMEIFKSQNAIRDI